jgi:magnesium transporter
MLMDKVSELLKKQRRVENMVHGQTMPRHDMVETLVHRQHSVELQNFIAQTPSEEIGAILEALPADDAALFWQQVSETRQNEVLWEVSDACRERLVGNREPAFDAKQMNAFELREGRLQQIPIDSRKNLDGIRPVWIDLINATKAERSYVGTHFGLVLPDP